MNLAGACRSARRVALLAAAIIAMSATAEAGAPVGTAHLQAVDARTRTVVMLGEAYHLPASTPIVDWHGRRMDIADLRAIPKGAVRFADGEVDVMRWTAVETPGGWVLQDVRILEHMPD
jgi:hypothetical protein